MLISTNFSKFSRVIFNKGLSMKRFAIADVGFYKKYKSIFEEKNNMEKYFPMTIKDSKQVGDYLEIPEDSDMKFSNKPAIDALNSSIFHPSWAIIKGGGKRWRAVYGSLIGKLLCVDIEKEGENQKLLIDILSCVELIHNGTVVLDDLADGSTMRRGVPCIHYQYGYGVGVNAGASFFFHPLRQFIRYRPTEAAKFMKHFMEEISLLFTGQSLDAVFRVDNVVPTEENYIDISMCKAALLSRLIVKLLFESFSQNEKLKNELIAINDKMFLIHQMKDDLANLNDSSLARMKGYIGEDITEGKVTLMAIKTLEWADEKAKKRFVEIMVSQTKDQQLILEAIKIIKDCGAMAYHEKKMNDIYSEVRERIGKLGSLLTDKENPAALEELMGYSELLYIYDK